MKIATSNPKKLSEFKKIIPSLEAVEGKDLPEVDGSIDDVILYKSIDAGVDLIVEDTILARVNELGEIIEEIVDIRWRVKELQEGEKVRWITSIGYNNGTEIIVYRGYVDGVITKLRGAEGFAFDPYFVPVEYQHLISDKSIPVTLTEFDELGRKEEFSARAKALFNLRDNIVLFSEKISNIPRWEGKYQH